MIIAAIGRTIVLGATSALLLAGVPAQAQVAGPLIQQTSEADIALLRSGFDKYDVAKDAQERLINEFVTGSRVWDSQSGAEPVSTTTTRAGINVTTISRYADGSVTASTVEEPPADAPGSVSTRGIDECHKRVSGGSTYMDNCRIWWEAVSWSMSFRSSYRFNSGGSAIYSANGMTFGGAGSFKNATSSVVHSPAGRSDASHAKAKVIQETTVFTRTVGIDLKVTPQGGKTSSFGS